MVRSTVHISGGSLAREPPEEIRSLGKHMTLPTTAEGSGGNRDNDHETRLPRARAYSGTFFNALHRFACPLIRGTETQPVVTMSTLPNDVCQQRLRVIIRLRPAHTPMVSISRLASQDISMRNVIIVPCSMIGRDHWSGKRALFSDQGHKGLWKISLALRSFKTRSRSQTCCIGLQLCRSTSLLARPKSFRAGLAPTGHLISSGRTSAIGNNGIRRSRQFLQFHKLVGAGISGIGDRIIDACDAGPPTLLDKVIPLPR